MNSAWKRAADKAYLLLASLHSLTMWVRSALVVPTKEMKVPCLPLELAIPAVATRLPFSRQKGWWLGTDHRGWPILEFIWRTILEANDSTPLVLLESDLRLIIWEGQLKLRDVSRFNSA